MVPNVFLLDRTGALVYRGQTAFLVLHTILPEIVNGKRPIQTIILTDDLQLADSEVITGRYSASLAPPASLDSRGAGSSRNVSTVEGGREGGPLPLLPVLPPRPSSPSSRHNTLQITPPFVSGHNACTPFYTSLRCFPSSFLGPT